VWPVHFQKDELVSGKRLYLLMVASIATLFVLAACSEEAVPTQEPVVFNPTAAAPADRPPGDSSEVAEPVATGGDAVAGQSLFAECGACHSTGDDKKIGPGLAGVYARAGDRTSLDADAYIEQSVRDPGAFLVDGFGAIMPSFSFTDDDVEDLIAYLKTLE
jgi:cytochrome c2